MNYITFNRLNDDEQRAGQHVSTEEFNAIYRPWLGAAYRRIGNAGGTAGNAGVSAGQLEADSSDALEITVGAAQA